MRNEGQISVELFDEEYDRIKIIDTIFSRLGELYQLEQAGGKDTDFLEGIIEDLLQRQLSLDEATCALCEYLNV
ncbi:MAG: hypothetical protein WAX44_02570 [Minisyncoccia bacterium]